MARIDLKWFSLSTVEREYLALLLMLGVKKVQCDDFVRPQTSFCPTCGASRMLANSDGEHWKLPARILLDLNETVIFTNELRARDPSLVIMTRSIQEGWSVLVQRVLPDQKAGHMPNHMSGEAVGKYLSHTIVEAILEAYNYRLC